MNKYTMSLMLSQSLRIGIDMFLPSILSTDDHVDMFLPSILSIIDEYVIWGFAYTYGLPIMICGECVIYVV